MTTMSLSRLLETYQTGDEWAWETELDWLWSFHAEQLDALADSVQRDGIRVPIELGPDGRVWDGHHRIAVAVALALDEVPVVFVSRCPAAAFGCACTGACRREDETVCHCGEPVALATDYETYKDLGPASAGLCVRCLPHRCDTYFPGACGR